MSNDLTIQHNNPLWTTGHLSKDLLYDSFSFDTLALGGYWSSRITLSMSKAQAEDWYTGGIGRDIKIFNPNLLTIWNGFVNKIDVSLGTLTATRGPLTNVANKVRLVYSTIDTSTDPPILGVRESTDWAQDTDSQGKYGIIEKVLSTGGTTPTNADQIRDTFLDENKEPETSPPLNIGQESNPTVTMECLGYVHWLKLFTYSSTTTGTRSFYNRILDILGTDPNSIFSTDYSYVTNNTSTVPRYDNKDRLGWQIIKEIVAKGDASFNRYIFGIYNNQMAHYSAIPTEVEYTHRLVDNKQRITSSGGEVKPWDVLPGKWLRISDWLIGKVPVDTALREDDRNLFIEGIHYSTPYGLSISGNKVSTLNQILGRLGLSGIGT